LFGGCWSHVAGLGGGTGQIVGLHGDGIRIQELKKRWYADQPLTLD
jgi:hypothetical protein